MKRIDEIQQKRKAQHIIKRLQKGVEDRKKSDRKLVDKNMHMLKSPAAKLSRKGQKLMEIEEESDFEEQAEPMLEVEMEGDDEE